MVIIMLKKIVLIFFLSCLFVLSVACGENSSSGLNNYIYLPQRIDLADTSYPILGASAHGERIYYWYIDSAQTTVIVNIDADGSDRLDIRIQPREENIDGAYLQIINDYIHVITTTRHEDGRVAAAYVIYDMQGSEISSMDLSNIIPSDAFFFRVEQTIFDDDGNMAIVTGTLGERNELQILSNDGTLLGSEPFDHRQSLTRLKDGRLVALFKNTTGSSLREIDFTTGSWGAEISISIPDAQRILEAGNNQPFDLLVDNGRILYGYTLNSNTQVPLINWHESNMVLTHDYCINTLPDGRIVVQYTEYTFTGRSVEHLSDLFVLTRTARSDLPDVQMIVTLGGLRFSDDIRNEVNAFNRENHDIQIQLINYSEGSVNTVEASMAAEKRFQIEIMTGRGPDIIYGYEYILKNTGYLADLYTFIDNDPELDRTDFFINILQAMEAIDGTLPFIVNSFNIETMITMRETAERIGPLTFENLLKRLDEPDKPLLFGDTMFRESFVHLVVFFSDDRFIDWKKNKAYLDSDDFVYMLEMALNLNDPQDNTEYESTEPLQKIQRGEVLLHNFWIENPNYFHLFQAILGDIVAVGMPGNGGRQHAVRTNPGWGIGINAGSSNQEAAWSFIKRLLLPEKNIVNNFPLRIDIFDDQIAMLMTPNIIDNEEHPIRMHWGGEAHKIYAMTEEGAATIRTIIDEATLFSTYDNTVSIILDEEIQPFFTGVRTAADTARIIQNRVQTYLNERN